MTELIKPTMCDNMTGSYDGKTFTCNCNHPNKCWFTKEERDKLVTTEAIVQQKEINFLHYQKINNILDLDE